MLSPGIWVPQARTRFRSRVLEPKMSQAPRKKSPQEQKPDEGKKPAPPAHVAGLGMLRGRPAAAVVRPPMVHGH